MSCKYVYWVFSVRNVLLYLVTDLVLSADPQIWKRDCPFDEHFLAEDTTHIKINCGKFQDITCTLLGASLPSIYMATKSPEGDCILWEFPNNAITMGRANKIANCWTKKRYCIKPNNVILIDGHKQITEYEGFPSSEFVLACTEEKGYHFTGGIIPPPLTWCKPPLVMTPIGCIFLDLVPRTFGDSGQACLVLGASVITTQTSQEFTNLREYLLEFYNDGSVQDIWVSIKRDTPHFIWNRSNRMYPDENSFYAEFTDTTQWSLVNDTEKNAVLSYAEGWKLTHTSHNISSSVICQVDGL